MISSGRFVVLPLHQISFLVPVSVDLSPISYDLTVSLMAGATVLITRYRRCRKGESTHDGEQSVPYPISPQQLMLPCALRIGKEVVKVSCSDNHIHLLKMPTMDISKSISGIKPPFSFPLKHEGSCTQVAFEQTTGLVAVSTEDYCVQFYSLFDNHEVSEVQVCKRNFQPADDVMLYVALVAISLDGSLMATIDVTIPEEKLGGLVCLKYWTRGSLVAEYLLSTVIYEPHSDAQVSSLAFRPGHNMAVTSSYGGDFKVWVHGSHADRNNESIQRTGWRCQSVGSYKGKSLTAAAFSADGSVLAIAAETIITLWDPDSNILVAMIGDTLSPITKPSFVGESEYLVSYTHAVSCSHDESQFAVLALLSSAGDADAKGNGVIFFFDVEDPVPVAT
ncbi:hypothetical protein ZIOFF_043742 [Zingiber officinale]|uniref:WD repeat-containing protein 75 second beta-propeller domain-containing protein n=1 Tax=Zingiber officinale TaxID=94328 RepID=A0A8J5KZR4_ZINOF|nr:hypothetical protein ZIOFF_043742 [Zingiber officinale]